MYFFIKLFWQYKILYYLCSVKQKQRILTQKKNKVMKTRLFFDENTIVAFKISNGGKLSCLGEHQIGEFTSDLIEKDGEYYDDSMNSVGLTVEEEATGIGRIDIDGVYDTVYTKYLADIDYTDREAWALVHDADSFTAEQAVLYFINGESAEHAESICAELDVDYSDYCDEEE